MNSVLPASERRRLISCLTLWERPASNAERDAAAGAAIRILKARGLAWSDVIAPPQHRPPMFSTWRTTCSELAQRQGDLRPWERGFIADLPRFTRISTKQRYVLHEIASRVLGEKAP